MKFEELIQDKDILKAITDLGFIEPTPIQEESIPPGLEGRDVIGLAKTGSGKTFAFGIPIVHRLNGDALQAMVIGPTRELSQQISDELVKLVKYKKTKIATVYGGVGINPQIDDLAESQIVVGTPGRLLDHIDRGTLNTDSITTLVLDEADRMFDMGFIEDIEAILEAMPYVDQILLFSATMPKEIKKLAEDFLEHPVYLKTSSHIEQEYLPQFYYVVEYNKKFSLLCHLIEQEKPEVAIIFCGTRRNADAVARNLKRHNIRAQEIHGGLSQAKRNQVMEDFKKGKINFLIATDVASRGLHIDDVTHVFNYDVPQNPEDYIHRIGRTARAGKSGKALTLLEQRDFDNFQAVLQIVPQEPEKVEMPNIRSVAFRREESNRGPPRNARGGPPRRRFEGGGGNRGGFGGRRESGGGGSTQSARERRRARRSS